MILLLFSTILLTQASGINQPRITVGSGLTCHYPPEHINQALQEHNTLYLTTETVFPPIRINVSDPIDSSYYFISTFMEDHIDYHADLLFA